jgi:Ca-activated chloride channel family protein
MPDELSIQSTLSRSTVPVMTVEQLVYCLLEMRPVEVAGGVPLPLNLCLVLDRSGSMGGSKMDNLREATTLVIDLLQPQDYLAVIFFNSRHEVVFPSRQISDEARRAELKSRVAGLKASGGTNMAPAMEAGLEELRKNMAPGGGGPGGQVNRMVLLTDGITEKEKRCLEQAEQAGRIGVPITALGIGTDWNDKLMQAIGSRSGGDADYIDSPESIRSHFARAVQQMQAVVLRNAGITVRPALGINVRTIYRVHPLISRLDTTPGADRAAGALLGDLEREHGQTVLVEFVVPSRPPGAYRIAQIDVEYDVPRTALLKQRAVLDVLLSYSHDPAAVSPPNPTVMNIVEKVSAFKLQTRALEDLEAGNIPAATQKLQGALTHLLNQGDTQLAAIVRTELTNLEKGRTISPEGRKTIRFESGKTVRLNKTQP